MSTGLISSLRRSRSFYLLAICLSLFTDTFLYAVIVPVLPFALSERANIQQSDVQTASALLLTTYGATMLLASPLVGFIADRTSRRFSFLFGLIGLAGSSLLFYLGRQLWVLFVARVLQGFAAATVLTVAFALISEVFSKDQLGYVFGYTELSMTFGSVLGPSVGAVVFDNLGYYAVFQVILGIIAVDVISRLMMGDKTTLKHSSGKTKIPSLNPPDFGTFQDEERNQQQEEEQRQGKDHNVNTVFSALDPFLHMLRSPRVITGLFGIFTQATVQSAFDGILPLYLKYTFDWSPSLVGFVFLAFAIPSLLAPMVGTMCSKWPPRRLALISFTLQIPNQLVLGCVQQNSMLHKILLWVSLVNLGVCLALAFTPLRLDFELSTDEVEMEMAEKSPNDCVMNISAQAYGLYNSCFSLGMLFGPLWADFGVTHFGWRGMTCSLGVLSFFAANLVYFNMGRPRNAGYAVIHT